MKSSSIKAHAWVAAIAAAGTLAAGVVEARDLTLYSGRGETLVAPIIKAFTDETGIRVNVRYGGTAELAVLLQEEGRRSPADLFWAQDAAALGAVAGLFSPLPQQTLDKVPPVYRDREGRWIATSGRSRLVIYSTERMKEADLPQSMHDLIDPKYKGRIALPPTNGSFLAHVTALRVAEGEARALAWLKGIKANEPVIVRNNTAAHQAIANGDADIALVNNYYLGRFLGRDPNFPVAQAMFTKSGDIGNLMLVAGMGVLNTSRNKDAAVRFIDFLLSPQAQQFFTGEVHEFPVTKGIIVSRPGLSFEEAQAKAPDIDLNTIGDLEGTLAMVREAGLL